MKLVGTLIAAVLAICTASLTVAFLLDHYRSHLDRLPIKIALLVAAVPLFFIAIFEVVTFFYDRSPRKFIWAIVSFAWFVGSAYCATGLVASISRVRLAATAQEDVRRAGKVEDKTINGNVEMHAVFADQPAWVPVVTLITLCAFSIVAFAIYLFVPVVDSLAGYIGNSDQASTT